MPINVVESVLDAMTTNQWVMEINGKRVETFSSISGINRQTQAIQRGDGGTGQIYNFTNQQVRYGTLSLTRQRDPKNPSDVVISPFVDAALKDNTKFSGVFIKYNHGQPVFKILFTGLLFTSENHPSYDKTNSGILAMTYQAAVDFWEEQPISS